MPQEERTLILLPRAMDQATEVEQRTVGVRPHSLLIYVRRSAMFRNVEIVDIRYSPSWAKFQVAVMQAGIELQRYSGGEGVLEIGHFITDMEPSTLLLENNSIDTDVRLTIRCRGWQYGEM